MHEDEIKEFIQEKLTNDPTGKGLGHDFAKQALQTYMKTTTPFKKVIQN